MSCWLTKKAPNILSMNTTQDQANLQNLLTGAPIIQVQRSTLGGENRASLMILVVLDEKSTWTNGIMENSRYSRFSIHADRLESFSGSTGVKFRSTKIKNIEHAAQKINEWIAKAKAWLLTKSPNIVPTTKEMTMNDFNATIETFRASVEKMMNDNASAMYGTQPRHSAYVITLEAGPKYVRVVRQEKQLGSGDITSRSVYCFIQKDNGDILKAAGWKAPAKTARGNIFNTEQLQGCGPYGVQYLRWLTYSNHP